MPGGNFREEKACSTQTTPKMSLGNRKKHWTHQQGIAHKLSAKYEQRSTHWVVFSGVAPGVYNSFAKAMEKVGKDSQKKVKGYPNEGAAIEAFTRHFLKKVKP